MAGIAALALTGAVAIAVVRLRKARHDSDDLKAGVEIPADLPAPTSDPIERRVYNVHLLGSAGDAVVLGDHGLLEILIGDHPLADIPTHHAEGTSATLSLDGDAVALTAGEGVPIYVGRRRVAPGQRQRLPLSGAEILIGRDVFEIYPETILEEAR